MAYLGRIRNWYIEKSSKLVGGKAVITIRKQKWKIMPNTFFIFSSNP